MKLFRYSLIMLAVTGAISVAQAQNWTFDASQLGGNADESAVALFNSGGQLPGTYRVDIMLNGERVDTQDIRFRQQTDVRGQPVLKACLTVAQLSRYGIRTEDYPALAGKSCADLSVIPSAQENFDFNGQQLLLSIPQASLRPESADIAPQALWNDGIPAFLMNYQAGLTRTAYRQSGGSDASQYLELEPGMNLGPWRLRNATTWQKNQGESGRWETAYTYLDRGLYGIKSRLTLGERFTPGDVFDSVPFRGVMLSTDEQMVPSSLRSFSPVVRGIARTQARVEVRQNGYTLYSATVAPGPFSIGNLSTGSSGGDLHVTVSEADGSTQVFIVPYQTPAIALHEGYMVYNLMAGQYRSSDSTVDTTPVAQASVMYGLPWNMTVYGGTQWSERYQAASVGIGMSLGEWGSVSLDGTGAVSQQYERERQSGDSWRVRYSKFVEETDTTLALSSYQYDSAGYHTLSDVLDTWQKKRSGTWQQNNSRSRRSRSSLSLSQSLGDFGSLSMSGSRDTWRGGYSNTTSYGAGYNVSVKGVSLSLDWTQNLYHTGQQWKDDRVVSLMVSVPLDRWLGGSMNASWQMTSPSSGGDTQRAGLSGAALEHQLNWNVSRSHRSGAGSERDNSALQLGWSGGYGQINGSYSYSQAYRQSGLDAEGGIVITRDGLTAGQSLDGAVALAEAPGASGVPVNGWPGIRTDYRGYTVLPGLQPYQENVVSLDPTRLPADAEITQTDVKVVPTEGAVIPATYSTHVGSRALITLTRPGGRPVPFGALVTVPGQASATSGVSDENGRAYLAGLEKQGNLLVRWGNAAEQQCRAAYRLPEKAGRAGLTEFTTDCR